MLQFNLKKKEAIKELYFNKNNILSMLGEELLNTKLNFMKNKPIEIIQFGENFEINDFNKQIYLLKNLDELLKNRKKTGMFLSNFGFQIYLTYEENLMKLIYKSLNKEGVLCFNLITENSFITLKKLFYEIDENLFNGAFRRFGPFHDVQNVIEKLNKSNFKETVVSTENLELNYRSLKKMRKEFKEFGISNYYNDKIKFKKDFFLITNRVFEKIIKKNDYFPIELEIATFTTWK